MVIPPVSSIQPASTIGSADKAGAASGSSGGFLGGLNEVQASLDKADKLASQLADGTLTDVHTYMAAATKAELALQMTVAMRDKAIDAYQEIMRMQV
jgi:flagellar hook-basal body complex protein FliE